MWHNYNNPTGRDSSEVKKKTHLWPTLSNSSSLADLDWSSICCFCDCCSTCWYSRAFSLSCVCVSCSLSSKSAICEVENQLIPTWANEKVLKLIVFWICSCDHPILLGHLIAPLHVFRESWRSTVAPCHIDSPSVPSYFTPTRFIKYNCYTVRSLVKTIHSL